MEKFTLTAQKRDLIGSAHSKRLRKQGSVPAVIYGKKTAPVSVLVNNTEFEKLFKHAGESSIIELKSGSDVWNVVISDVQTHPYKQSFVHIDFHAVSMDEEIVVSIPVEFTGTPIAVKEKGGVLFSNMDEIEIECLPGDLIHKVEVDVSALDDIGSMLHVSDIVLPPKVKLKTDPEDVLVSIAPPVSEADMVANTETLLPESETGQPAEGTESEAQGEEPGAESKAEEKSEEKK